MVRVAFVIGDYPPEQRKLREDAAKRYASADVDVGILSVPARPFDGLGPAEIQGAAPIFFEAFRQAEREGYDAVVPLGTLDLGVDGGKSAVDIPVVGPTEACLHVASLIGDRFGVMVYHPSLVTFSRAIIRRYSMEQHIVGFGVSGFDLPDLAAHHDEVVANFVREATKLVDQGAEVIYPMGISQCPVHIKPQWLQEQVGVPVVEGIGTPIRMAGMLAGLGLSQSRVRWVKSRN